MSTSIFDAGLQRTAANYAALSPLSFVERSATVFPDLPAVVHGSGRDALRYTWREVYARSRRLAHALQKSGIGRGDTVAAMLPNTPAMVEAHYGVPMSGAVLNALNTRLDPESIAFMLQHGEAKLILVDREFASVIKAALSLVPLLMVAWADGTVQDNERNAILQGAHGKGLEEGTDGYELLQTWLAKRPSDDLFAAWEAYIKALAGQLNDEQNRLLKTQIVNFAKVVAESAGGFLGVGRVSSTEEKVLARIADAFAR